MLTVTQLCDSCGHRIPVDDPCRACRPPASPVATVVSRVASLWHAILAITGSLTGPR